MEIYNIENLKFNYPNRINPALDDINIKIERGEFITLCGASGCGKTTLLRHLKPSAAPHGVKSGIVYFDNKSLKELSDRDAASKIGFVTQSPDNQIVTDRVWHELAFGLESLGFKTPEIRLRVAEMASFFGIQTWFHKNISELSGGQKQLLTLASVMAMQPSALILDEPTSQLDPIAAGEFLSSIGKINRELGVTVILTEHRLEEAFPLSSRALVMDKGRIIADGTPKEAGIELRNQNHKMFPAMPTPMRVWSGLTSSNYNYDNYSDCPVTIRDGANWLSDFAKDKNIIISEEKININNNLNPAIEIDGVWFKYEKKLPDIIKNLSFRANYGEITAVLGGNGAGKTTALSLIAGLYKPYRGKIKTNGRVCALPQNPQTLFVCKTVREDLLEILEDSKISGDEKNVRVDNISELCRINELLDYHPYDLSGGEQQRAALAKALLTEPEILLLDEPTKGLDAEFKNIFAGILRELTNGGAAVVMASHDVEFCAEYTDRCALFFDGCTVTENTPREFFSGNNFYTTGANRMARDILPKAITPEDIIFALGENTPGEENSGPKPPSVKGVSRSDGGCKFDAARENANPRRLRTAPPSQKGAKEKGGETENCSGVKINGKNKLPKRTVAAAAIILLAIPLTIFAGSYFFGDRSFYFISVIIIVQTMLPFAMVFESRKPRARELVVIAVLCALGVAGRAAFFMLPQFKPVIAIVIIAGVALGGEAGFLVGAATAFVSNMFFGQGPLTPYQMFAFGIIGFLAGVLFKKGLLSRSRKALAVFGAAAAFIIYGGIVNPAIIIIWQSPPTKEMFLAGYLQGIPMDLIHAAATVIFLLTISKPMLEKLDRIKIKYGLLE